MKKLRELDKENKPNEWLMQENPETWARSYFSTKSKCDIQVNNLSESFNKYILLARDKLIISMVEWIRRKLMNKKNGMKKYGGSICPIVQQKLESNNEDARNLLAL